ncbi:MAG TPA: hypothetical protein VMU02_06475 [bacterium]|nr:hypothetical protein [bacterium]
MKRKMLVVALACTVLLALAVGIALAAHPGDTPRERDKMARALTEWKATGDPRELVEVYRVWKLTGALGLTDDQVPGFVAKLERIDEKRKEALDGERKALGDIDRLLADKNTGEAEFAQALSKLEEMRRSDVEELRKLREDAASGLTARQKCEFLVFESHFRQDMRHMIDRARVERRERWGDRLLERLRPLGRERRGREADDLSH